MLFFTYNMFWTGKFVPLINFFSSRYDNSTLFIMSLDAWENLKKNYKYNVLFCLLFLNLFDILFGILLEILLAE